MGSSGEPPPTRRNVSHGGLFAVLSKAQHAGGEDHFVAKTQAAKRLEAADPEDHWYWRPKRLVRWGEIQGHRHADWWDLFADLLMVAAAGRLGHFLEHNLLEPWAIPAFAAFGLALLNGWSARMVYRARYDAQSPFHHVLDCVDILCVAAAAHNLVQDPEELAAIRMHAFLFFIVFGKAVRMVRQLDLVLSWPRGENESSPHFTAATRLLSMACEVLIESVGFFTTTIPQMSAVLLCAWVLSRSLHRIPFALGCYQRRRMVPMHIEFTISRLGELVMLMLGEGAISLVSSTLEVDKQSLSACLESHTCWLPLVKAIACFICGFVSLASFVAIYYNVNPFVRHHHCARRSAPHALIWELSHHPLALSLVALGVATKGIQPFACEPARFQEVILLSGATAVALSLMALQQLLHPGIVNYLRAPRRRVARLSLLALKAIVGLAVLCLQLLPASTEGWVILALGSTASLFAALVTRREKSPACEQALWAYIDAREAAPTHWKTVSLRTALLGSLAHEAGDERTGAPADDGPESAEVDALAP